MSGPRPLRAPRDDGAIVAGPPLEEVGHLLAFNRRRLENSALHFLGRPWQDLRAQARREVLAAARDYLCESGEPVPDWQGTSLLMAGHQPELFHPGVWVKSFALSGLARQHGAVPLNLVVDNDTVKAVGLHVPVVHQPLPLINESQPRLITVAFDRLAPEVPYEERIVRDEALFASFSERVPKNWGFEPLLEEFWSAVRQQSGRTSLLGERFASARRAWERRWGCHNLEVPVSRVSRTGSFAWFACHLLADLSRFQAIYNDCAHAYRQAHGIRRTNHPVPDLAKEDDWLEAPMWAWRAGETRRRLFARRRETQVELRAGDELWPALPLSPQHSVAAWQELERRGLKVRPRALTNTLFARLFLAELFIHGIGGGKYDELTDEIIRRFYGIEPPAYLVLSATHLLPFPIYPARPDDCRQLARARRDLHWNPQRHINLDSAAAKLAVHKQAWINQQPRDRLERRERFRVLRDLTEHLRQYTSEREEDLRDRLARCEQEVQANAVLKRRDYAFCLYPEAPLRDFCRRFLMERAS